MRKYSLAERDKMRNNRALLSQRGLEGTEVSVRPSSQIEGMTVADVEDQYDVVIAHVYKKDYLGDLLFNIQPNLRLNPGMNFHFYCARKDLTKFVSRVEIPPEGTI